MLKKFLAEAKRLTGKKVLWVRVDRGQEWDNWLWTEFKNQQGFIIEFTTAYAHQQNGAAERSMCTILDTARSMLVDSGLPTVLARDSVDCGLSEKPGPFKTQPRHDTSRNVVQKQAGRDSPLCFWCDSICTHIL